MEIVQAVKKLNSISRERLNFRRRFFVQLCIETLCKRATLVAHLTNFSFEFFIKFSQKIPLYFFYTMVQKVKNDQNSNQGGPALTGWHSWRSRYWSIFEYFSSVPDEGWTNQCLPTFSLHLLVNWFPLAFLSLLSSNPTKGGGGGGCAPPCILPQTSH